MGEVVLQRIVMPPRRGLSRLYCRFDGGPSRPRKQGRRTIVLPRGTVLRTDTWFNALFENHWREHTQLAELILQLRVSGAGALRLFRCGREGEKCLLREIDFSGHDRELRIELADVRPASGSYGMMFFELESYSSGLVLHRAEWLTTRITPRPIRLAVGICTFNRASQLIQNVHALLADPVIAKMLDRIIVVDQGSEKVRDHPAFASLARVADDRLQLVDQDNFGGAGGFTRCLLEAQRTDSATHILLMDDDIIPEPESVFRAAAFLSLASADLAVGGHMLDRFRPRQLVESGSRFSPERVRIDEPSRHRLDRASDLMTFLEPRPRHYNGWWFFAFPLAVLDRTGLPLPLFLRGDDLEFGCRLMRQGVPTVSLPGIAVWHEPFERKGRGWHAFYELRNLLIVGALHFPIVRAATVARQFFSRLLDELLTYDYYESWLLCEAVTAYLCGPEALRAPPHVVHQRLLAMGDKLASQVQPLAEQRRAGSVSDGEVAVAYASGSRLRAWRWWLIVRNLLLPSPAAEAQPRKVINRTGEQWYDISNLDVVGVAQPHRAHIVILRRSRARFIRLLFRGSCLALQLLVCHRSAVKRWRASVSMLTSRMFWMDYLSRPASSLTSPQRKQGRHSNLVALRPSKENGIDRGDHEQAQDTVLQLD